MKPKKLAELLEIIHIFIVVTSISAMFLIFLSEKLKIVSAFWLAALWTVQQVFGHCPLTVQENKLRARAGEKVKEEFFVPRCFQKYLGIYIPNWLSDVVMLIYFIISLFVLITYFFL